jgi:CheY-like chemotaxis protein
MLKSNGNKPKVLLVEDDLVIQMVHKRYAAELGCELTTSSNGKDAVELAERDYDLILMDVGLPGLNGIDATTLIRAHEKINHHHAYIVAVTGYKDLKSIDKCLAAGMDGVLHKPIAPTELKKVLISLGFKDE